MSYNICNDTTRFLKILTKLTLNPIFGIKQCNEKRNSSKGCHPALSITNILAVLSYLPAEMTKLVAEVMTFEKIPYFPFSKEDLHVAIGDGWNNIYSSYTLADISVYKHIMHYNIKNIAIVQVGRFGGELVHQQQIDLWGRIINERHGCVQQKYIDPTNIAEIKSYMNYIRHDKSLQMIVIFTLHKNIKQIIELTGNITDKIWFWYNEKFEEEWDYDIDFGSLVTHNNIFVPLYISEIKYLKYQSICNIQDKSCHNFFLNDGWTHNYLKRRGANTSDGSVLKIFDGTRSLDATQVEALATFVWTCFDTWINLSRHRFYFVKFKNIISFFAAFRPEGLDFISKKPIVKKKDHTHNVTHLNREYVCEAPKCWHGFEPKYQNFYDNGTKTERFDWRCIKCGNNYIKSTNS